MPSTPIGPYDGYMEIFLMVENHPYECNLISMEVNNNIELSHSLGRRVPRVNHGIQETTITFECQYMSIIGDISRSQAYMDIIVNERHMRFIPHRVEHESRRVGITTTFRGLLLDDVPEDERIIMPTPIAPNYDRHIEPVPSDVISNLLGEHTVQRDSDGSYTHTYIPFQTTSTYGSARSEFFEIDELIKKLEEYVHGKQ